MGAGPRQGEPPLAHGYSADWIGYPTGACCNFKEDGGIFAGGTPITIKAEQLNAIFLLKKKVTSAPHQSHSRNADSLASRAIKNSLMKIAIFLVPEEDGTDIFHFLSKPRQK